MSEDTVTFGRIREVFRSEIPPKQTPGSKYQALSDRLMKGLEATPDTCALEVPIVQGEAKRVRMALSKLWARQGLTRTVTIMARTKDGHELLYVMRGPDWGKT